jgi:hypothetical protein
MIGVLGDLAQLGEECMEVRTLADDRKTNSQRRSSTKVATSASGMGSRHDRGELRVVL